jgi:hypothetical protein
MREQNDCYRRADSHQRPQRVQIRPYGPIRQQAAGTRHSIPPARFPLSGRSPHRVRSDIEHPTISVPTTLVSGGALAAAVSRAGGPSGRGL